MTRSQRLAKEGQIDIERYGVANVISDCNAIHGLKYFCSMWNVLYDNREVNIDIYTRDCEEDFYAVIDS